MQITHQADYAVRTVLFLARLGNTKYVTTSVVAEEQRIPHSFLSKIVFQLTVAGLLRTSRGTGGGISLAREPKDISLLEVIETIEGPIRLNECVSDKSLCSFSDTCPLRPVWRDTQDQLLKRLKDINFGQLLAQPYAIQIPRMAEACSV